MALPRKMTEKQMRSAGRKSRAKNKARKKLDRANSCTGKVRHSTRYGAISHLKKLGHAQMGLYEASFWDAGLLVRAALVALI